VTKSHFKKAKRVRKGPPKRKLEADIVKMFGEHKESQNGGFEVMAKSTTELIKVVFRNCLMQSH
jgi:hypothetical protein